MGHEETGILTTGQRAELMGAFNQEMAALDLSPVTDTAAGITIDMPRGQVAFSRTQATFVHYEGSGDADARVILISQAGDRARLKALFEVMQSLEIVPAEANARLRRDSFTIEGRGTANTVFVEARLSGDAIKSFALVWPDVCPRPPPELLTPCAQALK